ncbi:unnamed protein product [Peronospora effusa]|nr:unnamed protein product [Peronospora effusa]
MKVISTIISASLLIGSVTGLLGGVPVSPDGALYDRSLQQKRYVTGIRKTNDTKTGENFSFCGGAVITPHHVLTTATCVKDGFEVTTDGDAIPIKDIYKNPNFNSEKSGLYNFAVLKLKREVHADIKPVNLPIPGTDIQLGVPAMVMGWGVNATNGVLSEVLHKLEQQVYSDKDCRKLTSITTARMTAMCAGGEEGKSSCIGDDGGPLIYDVTGYLVTRKH